MIQQSGYSERLELSVARTALQNAGFTDVENILLSQSFLRCEVILNRNTTSYQFEVLDNVQNNGQQVSPTEQRLKQQDAFYTSRVGFWYEVYDSGLGGPNDALWRYYPLTYPSMAANETSAMISAYAYSLWMGKMRWTLNSEVLIPAWDLKRHLSVPETQKSAWNGAFPASTFYQPYDEFDGSSDAVQPMAPNVVLIGDKAIDIDLIYPVSIQNAIGELATVKAVLHLWGLLAQNVSKVR